MNDVMHRRRVRRILGDLKKVSQLRTRHRMRWVDFRGSQRPDEFARYGRRTRWGGGRWKSQSRKNVYLSPHVEEFLNSKVIKSIEPELRSRKCFSCFGIPMFYVYMLWTFYVRFTYSCMAMLHMVCKYKSTNLNCSLYCYVSLTTQWSISHLFTVKWSNSSLSNNSL